MSHQGINPGSSLRTVILGAGEPGSLPFCLPLLLFKKQDASSTLPQSHLASKVLRCSIAWTPAGKWDRSVHFKILFDTSPQAYFIAVSKPGIKHRVYRMSPAATKLMHSCKSPS